MPILMPLPQSILQYLAQGLRKLHLEPLSIETEEGFAEAVTRIGGLIVFVFVGLSFAASEWIYHDPWALVSFPTMILLILGLSTLANLFVMRHKIKEAGWLLVSIMLLGSVGSIFIQGAESLLTIPGFYLSILLTSIILPRRFIFPVTAFSVFLAAVSFLLSAAVGNKFSTTVWTGDLATNVIVLLPAAILLYYMRQLRDRRVAVLHDEIEQKEIAKRQAEQANGAKSQFLANMSHELRTPLSAINAYIEIMLAGMAGEFSPEQINVLTRVLNNSERLHVLIDDMLDVAQIEAGIVRVHAVQITPRELVSDVILGLQSLADKKGLLLRTVFDELMPAVVISDDTKLNQILRNLISNAIKFTPSGTITVEVSGREAAEVGHSCHRYGDRNACGCA